MPYNTLSRVPNPNVLTAKPKDVARMPLGTRVPHHRRVSDEETQTSHERTNFSASPGISTLNSGKDEDHDASVSDTDSNKTGTTGHPEQQCIEMEWLAKSDIMGLINQAFHSPSPALTREFVKLLVIIHNDVQKDDAAIMDEVRAEIEAFGENVNRLHETGVHKMKG